MNEQNPKIKVIKRDDRKPSHQDYERQHKVALFRLIAVEEPDLFKEVAREMFGFRLQDKAA